ncbi:MAG TPA: hypothetical protein VHB73_01635 [Alphaproteobacteria bacterium]|nr:hypothetical protein [Alphaproteobacteria bacterium]
MGLELPLTPDVAFAFAQVQVACADTPHQQWVTEACRRYEAALRRKYNTIPAPLLRRLDALPGELDKLKIFAAHGTPKRLLEIIGWEGGIHPFSEWLPGYSKLWLTPVYIRARLFSIFSGDYHALYTKQGQALPLLDALAKITRCPADVLAPPPEWVHEKRRAVAQNMMQGYPWLPPRLQEAIAAHGGFELFAQAVNRAVTHPKARQRPGIIERGLRQIGATGRAYKIPRGAPIKGAIETARYMGLELADLFPPADFKEPTAKQRQEAAQKAPPAARLKLVAGNPRARRPAVSPAPPEKRAARLRMA